MKFQCRGLLVALAVLLSVGLPPSAQENTDPFRQISEKLICQCGCNYGLAVCPHLNCPSAPAMRDAIRKELAAGKSEDEVVEVMIAQFGPAVMAQPSTEGFNLMGWLMPFVALFAGLFLVYWVLRAWRRGASDVAPSTTQPASPVLDRYREAIEREMKQIEE